MVLDFFIKQRLSKTGFIALIMAVTAIAEDIDDDILLEAKPVLGRNAGDMHDRFGVIAVHMKDRCFQHLGQVGAVRSGTGIVRIADTETDLIVKHDVHCAAGVKAAGL